MLMSAKRIRSFLSIALVLLLISPPTDGFAQSRLEKCPIDQSQRYHNCFGIYVTPNGNKYVGEWHNNKRHGMGTYTLANGNEYVGEYRDDKWHGKGTLTYADGSKYAGHWRDDKFHGYGILTYANGDEHAGEWQNGKMTTNTSPVKTLYPSINEGRIRIEKLQKESRE